MLKDNQAGDKGSLPSVISPGNVSLLKPAATDRRGQQIPRGRGEQEFLTKLPLPAVVPAAPALLQERL